MRTAIVRSVVGIAIVLAAFFSPLRVPAGAARLQPPTTPAWTAPPGINWQVEEILAEGESPSLVLDTAGTPHVSYTDNTLPEPAPYSLHYASRTGGSWKHEFVAEMQLGGISRLQLTSANQPVIAYTACNMYSCPLYLAQKDAGGWQVQDLQVGISGVSLSFDLDSGDRPHLAFCTQLSTTELELWHMYWSGSEWRTETAAAGCWYSTSIQMDSQDRPRISYYRVDSADLGYAEWTGSGWATVPVDTAGDVGRTNDLKLDAGGRPQIAYQDRTTGTLKYARWNGSGWETRPVDRVIPDTPISFAIDSDGHAHIAYSGTADATDQPGTRVRYAAWTGDHWSVGSVTLGEAASLALGAGNLPRIGFESIGLQYAQAALVPLGRSVFLPIFPIR